MQFLTQAIAKAGSTDSAKVSAALKGLTIETPMGPMTMRAKDQQAARGELWGKMVRAPGQPFPVMTQTRYIDPSGFMD